VLTGEVYLRPPELQAKLEEIRKQHLPETLQTLQDLNAVLDESRAKQLASAEEELEILAQLYDQNSAARNAAEILRQVLEVPPPSAQGGENVS
jgi:alkylhydroperoxidase/carboxymuconolactone decarboxylase family protein YurZ